MSHRLISRRLGGVDLKVDRAAVAPACRDCRDFQTVVTHGGRVSCHCTTTAARTGGTGRWSA